MVNCEKFLDNWFSGMENLAEEMDMVLTAEAVDMVSQKHVEGLVVVMDMGLADEALYWVFPAWTLDKKVPGQGPGYQGIQSQTQISQMANK